MKFYWIEWFFFIEVVVFVFLKILVFVLINCIKDLKFVIFVVS